MQDYANTAWTANINDPLALCWARFVDCPMRLRTIGPFLQRVLSDFPHPTVLDAAMGIGCEAVWMAQQGVDVTGNEISPVLREVAAKRADEHRVSLRMSSVDWRDLGDAQHDVVLLLGNSLSMMHDERDRIAAARALRAACAQNGKLVIDERNFRYILTNRLDVLAGQFRYSGRVIYCGTEIQGRPIEIAEDCIRFGYFEGEDQVGTLDMHPFSPGEMIALFFDAGFAAVEVYSDLERGSREDADFFTYIFTP